MTTKEQALSDYETRIRRTGTSVPSAFVAGFAQGWDAREAAYVEPTDADIQRGVEIALKEGLSGRTWPEYIRAVYDAVSIRPAAPEATIGAQS